MWQIKKSDGQMYGPVELTTLRRWAADGRVAPEDLLSRDGEHWTPAPDVEGMEMDWEVAFEDGSAFGPVHILSLRDALREGGVSHTTRVKHRPTGRTDSLTDAMLTALLTENARLEVEAAELANQVATLVAETAALREAAERIRPPGAPAVAGEGGAATPPGALEGMRDRLQNEQTAFRERERELLLKVEELGQQMERLRKIGRPAASPAEGPADVVQLNAELSQQYDELLAQLNEKTLDLKAARDARTEMERDAEDRIRQVEKMLHREQDEALKSREKLADLETRHYKLLQSYREMNDRIVRMRRPAPAGSEPPPPEAPAVAAGLRPRRARLNPS